MEPVDWEKEPCFVKAVLPSGDEYCSGIKYDGRILPSFQDRFVDRMTEVKENFVSEEGDILIYGFMKSGTHWVWEIIRMILDDDDSVSEKCGKTDTFLESISLEEIDSLPRPRVLSTHLMHTGLPPAILNNSKVVVPIRHPKDSAVSMYHHLSSEKKGTDLRCGWDSFIKDIWFDPELAFYATWDEFTSYVWKQCRVNENYYPIIYEQLLEDPVEIIRDLGKFLGKEGLSEERLQKIATATRFDNMKKKKTATEKPYERTFHEGYTMFRKGVSGDWKEHFTKEQNDMFNNKMEEIAVADENIRQVMLFYDDDK